jgi:RNA-directed DNA polymerase
VIASRDAVIGVLVWDVGRSERRAVIARIPVETSPGAKASLRPTGLSLRENMKNLRHERTQMAGRRKVPGALSAADEWNAQHWPTIQKQVRRLQMRIAKAEKEKRTGKVKALQRILVHSFAAKLWAVRRVVTNNGRRTPGVDGVLWKTPGERLQAVRSLRKRGYRPQPLKRIYIPKKNGKLRPLSIPTMADRAMQALYLLALNPVAEIRGDPNSYGFRPYRSTADALSQCFIVFAKKQSPRVVFDADIKACFDRISHPWLLANIPMDKAILRKWLAAGYMEDTVLYPTEEGTPQGGIISPVLANLTLDGLERVAREAVPRRSLVNVVRYADDFVVTARTPEQLTEKIIPAINAFLAERGLELSPEKSQITDIVTGFDFLGATVRKFGDKLLIKPSRKSMKAFLDGIRDLIKAHAEISVADLIGLLNPRIRGWATYFRHLVSSRAFKKADKAIFDAMLRWMRRKHPGKGLGWIRKRYFRSNGSRNWIISATARNAKSELYYLDLFQASSLAIRRHVKVQAEATAFDPDYQGYFQQRWKTQNRLKTAGQASTQRKVSRPRQQRQTQPGHVTMAPRKA